MIQPSKLNRTPPPAINPNPTAAPPSPIPNHHNPPIKPTSARRFCKILLGSWRIEKGYKYGKQRVLIIDIQVSERRSGEFAASAAAAMTATMSLRRIPQATVAPPTALT